MKKKIRKLFIILTLVISPFFFNEAFSAGPPGPPGGGGGPPCWPPPCIPIDGGIGFLIAAGIAFGGKKAYDFTKRKTA